MKNYVVRLYDTVSHDEGMMITASKFFRLDDAYKAAEQAVAIMREQYDMDVYYRIMEQGYGENHLCKCDSKCNCKPKINPWHDKCAAYRKKWEDQLKIDDVFFVRYKVKKKSVKAILYTTVTGEEIRVAEASSYHNKEDVWDEEVGKAIALCRLIEGLGLRGEEKHNVNFRACIGLE